MRVVLTGVLVLLTVVFAVTGCKNTTAPTLPALDSASNMATVTAIVSGSDSARLTQTCVAAQTSTAVALLFTPTITVTSTQTNTATATFTATETPPPYVIYDDLTGTGAVDPTKWAVSTLWTGSTALYDNFLYNHIEITSSSYDGTPGSDLYCSYIALTSKYPAGTKGFKGIIKYYNAYLSNTVLFNAFKIFAGNVTDGYTQFFMKEFYEGMDPMLKYPVSFEVNHISGNTYRINITDCQTQFHDFTSQPQIKIYVIAPSGISVVNLDSLYFY